MTEPTWITLAQASKRINVSTKVLNRAIHATDAQVHLPARLLGNKWLLKTTDVDAWPEKALPAG